MEGMTSLNGADSYMTILNRRIRAYKKKIERINVLKDKKDLEPEQKKLCSHYALYSAILRELDGIKAQFLQLHPEVIPLTTPDGESPVVEDVPEVNEVVATAEAEDKQVESVAEAVVEMNVETSVEANVEETPMETPVDPCGETKEDEPVEEAKQTEMVMNRDNQPAEKQETRKHSLNRRRGPNDERRPRAYRGRNPMNKRTPRPTISKKDREDGWTIPKKVVHMKD